MLHNKPVKNPQKKRASMLRLGFSSLQISEGKWTTANGKLKIIREIAIKDQKGQIVTVSKATYFAMLVKK